VRPEHRGCQRPVPPARDIRCPATPDTWPGPIGPAPRADGPAWITRPRHRYRRTAPPSCKRPWHETAVLGPSRLTSQRSFRATPIATRPSRHTRRCNQPRPLIGISCMSAHRLACTHQAGLCPPSPGRRLLGGRTAPPSARISRELGPEVLPYARSGPHRYGHGPRLRGRSSLSVGSVILMSVRWSGPSLAEWSGGV
jgi:hypothetical protein